MQQLRGALADKQPDEMTRRLEEVVRYIKTCEARNTNVDWGRVKTESMRAFAASIISGSCGQNHVFELPKMPLEDAHFHILLEALVEKSQCKTGCPTHITLSFPDNRLTDTSLEAIAKFIRHDRFPEYVTIDLSGKNSFTDSGAKTLLTALAADDCNRSVNIKLVSSLYSKIHPDLLDKIDQQINDNLAQYQPKAKVKAAAKTDKKRSGLFASRGAEPKKTKEKKQTRRSGLFKSDGVGKKTAAAKKTSATKKKVAAKKKPDAKKNSYSKLKK